MLKLLIAIPFFIYTTVHLISLFFKLQSMEAENHLWEAILGLFMIYFVLSWGA